MEMAEEEDDDDDEEDDDEEDDDESEEETPVKAKQTPTKQKTPAQNGKNSKPGTPAGKQERTPKSKGDRSPKAPLSTEEIKTKMMEAASKGVVLPKIQAKFGNFVKNCHKVSNPKDIADLWKWRQTLKDAK